MRRLQPFDIQVKDHPENDGTGKSQGYKIKWAQEIGPSECPMMRRWVFEVPWFSIRLHNFLRSDDMRHLHDHPWWFVTLILRGSYYDITEIDGERYASDRLKPGSIRFRPANHAHAVSTKGCWSIVVTGPINRRWGFWDRGIFRPVSDYFRRYGYAPCE